VFPSVTGTSGAPRNTGRITSILERKRIYALSRHIMFIYRTEAPRQLTFLMTIYDLRRFLSAQLCNSVLKNRTQP